jgi:predicted porin
LMFKKMPLNVNVMLMHLNNETPVSDFKMNNYTSTISYKFMDKKISPSLSINVANISKSGFTKDKRVGVRLKSDYKINKKLKFRFSYRLNKYEYGSVRPNALSTENRLKFSLLKKF